MSTEEQRQSWSNHRGTATVVALLLLVHVGLGLHVASYNSVTNDEFWHIPTGLWNLTHGRFHYDNLNPPLLRSMAAVPLLFAGAETGDVDEQAVKEDRADAFVAANRERYQTLVFAARIVPILLSAVIGGILATWALNAFGAAAAVLATGMWALSPNVLGHATLVTTDVAAAGAMLIVIRSAWHFAGDPRWKRAIRLGLWLGIAQLVKFTCLLAVPLVIATWAARRWRNKEQKTVRPRVLAGLWLAVGCIGLLVLNAGYLFRGSGQPVGSYTFSSDACKRIAAMMEPLRSVPLPFPADYIEGLDQQRYIMEGGHPVYLDREWRYAGGFRDYYLKAWWYKTPHATQILCVLGLIVVCRPGRRQRNGRLQVVLLLPAVLLLLVASMSSMQMGIRYLIPALPFVFLLASQTASVVSGKFSPSWIAAVLLGLGLAFSLRHHPHHLSYFNEYCGGPMKGPDHLLDSNIDWGQELSAIRQYAADHQIDRLGLAYFGSVNPADYGIRFVTPVQAQPPTINWPRPEPGHYAISVNFLGGFPGVVRDPDGTSHHVGHNQFGYFRCFRPVDKIAYAIYVYKLTPEDIAQMPVDR